MFAHDAASRQENKAVAGERAHALEARVSTLTRVAIFQQVLLFGLLAVVSLSWGPSGGLEELDARIQQLERLSTHEARLDALELHRIKHDTRLELLERGTASSTHETRETLRQLSVAVAEVQRSPSKLGRASSRASERQLQAAESEQPTALIRVDAPEGVAQFVMGARAAVDNVIMEKEHADDGGEFTLSRNHTRVLGIDVDGGLTVHTDPLHVASTVRSAEGSPLHLQGQGGVILQSRSSFSVVEVDGQGRWSTQALRVYAGDSVQWSWINYHNVIETDAAGSIRFGGISSGAPMLSGTFTHTFDTPGFYLFKSQAQYTMTCTVEVLESFALQNGTLRIGGDLEIGGSVRSSASPEHLLGGAHPGFEAEVKMFLGSECPAGWREATELGGYFLMGRTDRGQVNQTKNRPMDSTEDGRMHSTYYRGNSAWTGNYDDRYFGGYYTSYGSSSGSSCTSRTCSNCRLPDGSSNVDCDANFGGHYQYKDYYYSGSSSFFRWDKLTNPAYQTPEYMGPIGEYYPFASVLLCKRA